ncbi:MAG TPA: hypothetical protein VFU99_05600 [Gaiellaceae bacterium]|nr:hypothetical protein [Gaiellaceae bacterium]
MQGTELLWEVYAWLPLVFALDLAVFHLTGDHPLALRWWVRRPRR